MNFHGREYVEISEGLYVAADGVADFIAKFSAHPKIIKAANEIRIKHASKRYDGPLDLINCHF